MLATRLPTGPRPTLGQQPMSCGASPCPPQACPQSFQQQYDAELFANLKQGKVGCPAQAASQDR